MLSLSLCMFHSEFPSVCLSASLSLSLPPPLLPLSLSLWMSRQINTKRQSGTPFSCRTKEGTDVHYLSAVWRQRQTNAGPLCLCQLRAFSEEQDQRMDRWPTFLRYWSQTGVVLFLMALCCCGPDASQKIVSISLFCIWVRPYPWLKGPVRAPDLSAAAIGWFLVNVTSLSAVLFLSDG